jgi:hypothetical protein
MHISLYGVANITITIIRLKSVTELLPAIYFFFFFCNQHDNRFMLWIVNRLSWVDHLGEDLRFGAIPGPWLRLGLAKTQIFQNPNPGFGFLGRKTHFDLGFSIRVDTTKHEY